MNAGHSLKKSHFFVIFLDIIKKKFIRGVKRGICFYSFGRNLVSKNKLGLLLIYQLQWEFTEKKNIK